MAMPETNPFQTKPIKGTLAAMPSKTDTDKQLLLGDATATPDLPGISDRNLLFDALPPSRTERGAARSGWPA